MEIFSGLVRLSPDFGGCGDSAAECVLPDLAERWDVNEDGTVYTFHLHENATFHDGRPVLAEDVKYSIERASNPETASVVAENFLGDIVGARDVSRGRADASVSGVRVVDDFTVEITIDAPKPYFLYKLTYPTAFVVDQRQIEANPRRWTQKPNGTGPVHARRSGGWASASCSRPTSNNYLGAPKLKTVRFELSGGSGARRVRGRRRRHHRRRPRRPRSASRIRQTS